MRIYDKKLDEITPYRDNPRNNAFAVSGVAESIAQFGFKQPIVVDAKGTIVCGHTRYLAAKKLGLESVPCVLADDLSETQIKAYRLLDNKLSEKSSWDDDLLAKELDSFEFDFTPFKVDFSTDAGSDLFEPRFDDEDEDVPHTFELVVECEDETEQDSLYERLTAEGFRVRTCAL